MDISRFLFLKDLIFFLVAGETVVGGWGLKSYIFGCEPSKILFLKDLKFLFMCMNG